MEIEVKEWIHITRAKRFAVKTASDINFTDLEIGEISIIVSELAENMIAHKAVSGKIIISDIKSGDRRGIQIIAEDKGPGIPNTEQVMKDGYSQNSSLGIGLGAVKRFSDEFDIMSNYYGHNISAYKNKKSPGTVIISRKWLKKNKGNMKEDEPGISIGVMSRPKENETHNGDEYIIKHYNSKTLIAVIDGLGHGPEAENAAKTGRRTIMENYQESLEVIIRQVHQDLKKKRGAVCSIALIDHKLKVMDYIGIGNVKTMIFNAPKPIRPVNFNGLLGSNLNKMKIFRFPWDDKNVIIMLSDGISGKFDFDCYPGILEKHPVAIADIILRDFSKKYDDATVVVGKKMTVKSI